MKSNLRADSHAKTNGNGIHQVLDGKDQGSAVMASSLICATKKLSTILYKEFTSMETTMGRAMDMIRGNTGFSFIKVLFIYIPPVGL